MIVGDMVKWAWHLGTDWELTKFHGVVVKTRIAKTDYEKVRILEVLANDGTVVDVRDDEAGLELVA